MNAEISSVKTLASPVARGNDSIGLRPGEEATNETSSDGESDALEVGQVRGDALQHAERSADDLRALVFGPSWETEQSEAGRVCDSPWFHG
mmetsp:Transcript_14186/g.57160  ORF Transcript_14186/g.57160 Transcript_14186/m.57160 type:complete len:91 (+) Transcript_14186:1321-1593(+)